MVALFTRTTVFGGIFGFALGTGCAGRSSSPGADRNPGDTLAGEGGKAAVRSEAGGAPGSAGQSSAGQSSADNGGSAAGAAAVESAPPEVTAACASLCSGWIHNCSIWEFGPSCKSDCASDLVVQDGACADLGVKMLSCMTATDGTAHDALCVNVFTQSIALCQTQVDAFRACTRESVGSAVQPKICMRAGNPLDRGCAENRACLDGKSWELRCYDVGDGVSSCTCSEHAEQTDFHFGNQSDDLCVDNITDCMAAVHPAR